MCSAHTHDKHACNCWQFNSNLIISWQRRNTYLQWTPQQPPFLGKNHQQTVIKNIRSDREMNLAWVCPSRMVGLIHNLTSDTRAGNWEPIVLFRLADTVCNWRTFCFVFNFWIWRPLGVMCILRFSTGSYPPYYRISGCFTHVCYLAGPWRHRSLHPLKKALIY